MKFDKKNFLSEVDRILRADYATELGSATKKELYNALSKAAMALAYDDWNREKNNNKKLHQFHQNITIYHIIIKKNHN